LSALKVSGNDGIRPFIFALVHQLLTESPLLMLRQLGGRTKLYWPRRTCLFQNILPIRAIREKASWHQREQDNKKYKEFN
jgi:hypothetical protein